MNGLRKREKLSVVQRGLGWIQHCDVIVFEKCRFHRSHVFMKTEFSTISTLESVFEKLGFGHRFHRIGVDGRYPASRGFLVALCSGGRISNLCAKPSEIFDLLPCRILDELIKNT